MDIKQAGVTPTQKLKDRHYELTSSIQEKVAIYNELLKKIVQGKEYAYLAKEIARLEEQEKKLNYSIAILQQEIYNINLK